MTRIKQIFDNTKDNKISQIRTLPTEMDSNRNESESENRNTVQFDFETT